MSIPEVPDDMILPEPVDQKEVDMNRALQDNSVQVRNALIAVGDTQDKVKASSDDPTAGYLDAKVDNVTIQESSEKIEVKALGIDTPQIALDAIDGTLIADDSVDSEHYVADSIDAEHLANDSVETLAIKDLNVTTGKLEADLAFATFPTTPSAAPDADYEVANKKYVDDELSGFTDTNTSNVIFSWSGFDGYIANSIEFYEGTSLTPDTGDTALGYHFFMSDSTTARTILRFKFVKIAGVSSVTIHGRLWALNVDAGREAILTVDIGTATEQTAKSVTSTSPTWYTGATPIDVSGLSDGTAYDGVIQLSTELDASEVYCSAVTLTAS